MMARAVINQIACLFSRLFLRRVVWLVLGLGLLEGAIAEPVYAHHAMGNQLPANAWEGLLSGLAHPVVGMDHLAFVIALGVIATQWRWGLVIPATFLLAAMAGTGLHLAGVDIPGAEIVIAGSVLLIGLALALGKRLHLIGLGLFSGLAGILHGYAYGESIVGAEATPLATYLLGFTLMQLAIALVAYGIGQRLLSGRWMRALGLAICTVGIVALSGAV
jgi:urease accessory protein